MAVTIKQISEISGVSRGTVDRVLNERGKVSPEKEALVRKVAKQLGYQPNLAGKALAARKKFYVIGVLLVSKQNPFFDDLILGAKQAEEELKDYGISLLFQFLKGYSSQQLIDAMNELKTKVHILIMTPVNDASVAKKINELTESGISVITVNTDIENSKRICYVGSDYYRSGMLAFGMLRLIRPFGGKLGILTGSVQVLGHNQRISGFRDAMKNSGLPFQMVDIAETQDDEILAFEAAKTMLLRYPDISSLYVVAGGTYGVCRAVLSLQREGSVAVIASDQIPSTEKMLREKVIQATICQRPYTQGYQSVQLAFQYLVGGKLPEKENFIVENEIKILESLTEEKDRTV